MNKGILVSITFWIAFIIACALPEKAISQEIPKMTIEELKANLNNKDFVIIDVRTPHDYDKSEKKIPGAIRENPMDVRYWYPYPKDKTIVLYCAWKNEGTSASVARELIPLGYKIVYALKGGWEEWHSAGYPVTDK